ncbi:MAG: sugar ABC transporter permease [Bacilli bacterium]|jgi:cellobiose transport system permease protein|nr:sugar ABC transporter permease [Bacilli bacterium]
MTDNKTNEAPNTSPAPAKPVRKYHKKVSYSKYGYLFLIPFFLVFITFSLIPLFQTFYYSFFQYYFKQGLTQVGPNFIGFSNFATILKPSSQFWKYFGNTMILWVCGFVPQIIISLLLAIWFTDARLKLKFSGFFKAVTYMPNLVMAAAFGMMFLTLFSQSGPISQIAKSMGWIKEGFIFTEEVGWTRGIIAFIDWLMWFGNTAILLMSGIMGIDDSIFESARLDGANATTTFWKITMPLLMPIFVYVFITSMIGGLQLFDVPQIFTQTTGGTDKCAMTIMMYLYNLISVSKNYGMAGALSVIIFLFTGILSIFVFKTLVPNYKAAKAEAKAHKKRMRYVRSIHRGLEPVTEGGISHD